MGLFSLFTNEEKLLKQAIAGHPPAARRQLEKRFLNQLLVTEEELKIETRSGKSLPKEAVQSFLEDAGKLGTNYQQPVSLRFKRHFDKLTAEAYRTANATTLRRLDNYLLRRFSSGLSKGYFRSMQVKNFQDAFSDAFVVLINILGSGKYEGIANLDTLFQGILENCCRRQAEKEKALKHIPAQPWDGAEEVYRATISEAAWQKIKGHLNNIDEAMLARDLELLREQAPKCYRIYWMHAVQGFTYAEIAQKLLPVSTEKSIKTQAERCRRKLSSLARNLKIEE